MVSRFILVGSLTGADGRVWFADVDRRSETFEFWSDLVPNRIQLFTERTPGGVKLQHKKNFTNSWDVQGPSGHLRPCYFRLTHFSQTEQKHVTLTTQTTNQHNKTRNVLRWARRRRLLSSPWSCSTQSQQLPWLLIPLKTSHDLTVSVSDVTSFYSITSCEPNPSSTTHSHLSSSSSTKARTHGDRTRSTGTHKQTVNNKK